MAAKRSAFFEHQALVKQRQAESLAKAEVERQKKAKERERAAAELQGKLEAAQRAEEQRVQRLIQKNAEKARLAEESKAVAAEFDERKAVRETLMAADRALKLQRHAAREAALAEERRARLQRSQARAEEVQRAKAALARRRAENEKRMLVEKHALKDSMFHMRVFGSSGGVQALRKRLQTADSQEP